MATTTGPERTAQVLLYSDDVDTRAAVRLAVGRRPARDLPAVTWFECATQAAVLDRADRGGLDLLILDGPAHAEQGGKVMAKASDLVVMPTGYSLDDMEPQIEAAYELEDAGIDPASILFVFCRAKGSDAEDRAARTYLQKAKISVLGPVFPELASIRQGHAEGRAASEVPFPKVQEKVIEVAQGIVDQLMKRRKEAA